MAEQRLPVPRLRGVSREQFMEHLYPQRKPLVLEGLDLGSCTSTWTVDYLSHTGGTKEVKVHVAPVAQMDFISKNFVYRTLPFNKLVQRAAEETHKEFFISEDEKYYLRSLGDDPRKDVADIRQQFPSLGGDITFPMFFREEQFFSSVFRISSPGLQLWTHYDVMDNFLIQVTGKKRITLFNPRDAQYLYLSGSKSEVLNIDSPDLDKYPLFPKARRYECFLEAGDVLFIPGQGLLRLLSLHQLPSASTNCQLRCFSLQRLPGLPPFFCLWLLPLLFYCPIIGYSLYLTNLIGQKVYKIHSSFAAPPRSGVTMTTRG
ncbi:tRNA wybutosine-synthesizing protein 5 isoform X3 [Arvicanthis niloticus]|uniref:tRNA wybutosine-synthesizing protein 5 isoform X3 n=1 Tax=Arvicanthis niloticus TaxID=61156 RepID=UPI00402B826E